MYSRILIVDEDEVNAELISLALNPSQFGTSIVPNVDKIQLNLDSFNPDVIVLNTYWSVDEGISVCQQLRHSFDGDIVITSLVPDDDTQVRAFESGVDEYIVQPYKTSYLAARLRVLTVRKQRTLNKAHSMSTHPKSDSYLEFSKGKFFLNRQSLAMTGAEHRLLTYLIKNEGCVLSRDDMMTYVKGRTYDGASRCIDLLICQLRRKFDSLGADELQIVTIRSKGYMLLTSNPFSINPHNIEDATSSIYA
ncbi:response regulator transcription factor [Photobacterium alginatilyticum]|uniref:response regulator transcription factor n=1 Tax=Photobacterium alginatilyticum TaxID=1775171 RepID=UPI0013683579|nr:response regulator transcription factor [Photobacterium alginatilyticum]